VKHRTHKTNGPTTAKLFANPKRSCSSNTTHFCQFSADSPTFFSLALFLLLQGVIKALAVFSETLRKRTPNRSFVIEKVSWSNQDGDLIDSTL
jgi:hypothetical protein